MKAGHPFNSVGLSRILVTGASGELGAALAQHYSTSGRELSLWGRNAAKLEDVAASCRDAGADATVRSLDLMDAAAAITALVAEDEVRPIDLLLLVAGLGEIRAADDLAEDPYQVMQLGLVNYVAPVAMAAAMAQRMAARNRGRIVIIGSAAAFHALPFASGYAGAKAGLARFADALRAGVAPHGVTVTLVSPGFIDTAAGRANGGARPFLMQPGTVAAQIARAADQGRAHLILPWPFRFLRWVDPLLPRALRDRLLLSLAPPRHQTEQPRRPLRIGHNSGSHDAGDRE